MSNHRVYIDLTTHFQLKFIGQTQPIMLSFFFFFARWKSRYKCWTLNTRDNVKINSYTIIHVYRAKIIFLHLRQSLTLRKRKKITWLCQLCTCTVSGVSLRV